jgi:hypothetical protein
VNDTRVSIIDTGVFSEKTSFWQAADSRLATAIAKNTFLSINDSYKRTVKDNCPKKLLFKIYLSDWFLKMGLLVINKHIYRRSVQL